MEKKKFEKVSDRGIMIFYTDGCCKGNPGPGGWGIYCEELPLKLCGGELDTTNNIMELKAIKIALKEIAVCVMAFSEKRFKIMSDSAYAIGCIRDWFPNWRKKGIKDKANYELIEEIYSTLEAFKLNGVTIELVKVAGHSGEKGNEIADQLANKGFREVWNGK